MQARMKNTVFARTEIPPPVRAPPFSVWFLGSGLRICRRVLAFYIVKVACIWAVLHSQYALETETQVRIGKSEQSLHGVQKLDAPCVLNVGALNPEIFWICACWTHDLRASQILSEFTSSQLDLLSLCRQFRTDFLQSCTQWS